MVILGIDPGTRIIGYGIIKKERNTLRALDFGVIKTTPEKTAGENLEETFTQLKKLIQTYKPEVIGLEKLFYFKNKKTVISVAEARGVILLASSLDNIPTQEYTPLEVKIAVTGYGRADKKQVQKMVPYILELEGPLESDDAADALAVAVCVANHAQ